MLGGKFWRTLEYRADVQCRLSGTHTDLVQSWPNPGFHRMHVHSGTALGTQGNSFRTHMPKSELTLKSNQLPSPAISHICLVAPQQQLCVCLCIWLRNRLSNSIRLDEKCSNMLCCKQFTVVFVIELHVFMYYVFNLNIYDWNDLGFIFTWLSRTSPEFQKLLGIAMEMFLLCSDDSESDVRMVADECLNKIIKVSRTQCSFCRLIFHIYYFLVEGQVVYPRHLKIMKVLIF